jgi:hypothetical protein
VMSLFPGVLCPLSYHCPHQLAFHPCPFCSASSLLTHQCHHRKHTVIRYIKLSSIRIYPGARKDSHTLFGQKRWLAPADFLTQSLFLYGLCTAS